MSFYLNTCSKTEIVNECILSATCQTSDGKTKVSEFELNLHLGNDDGQFKWGGGWKNFHLTANKQRPTRIEGSILKAELQNKAKTKYIEAVIDLNNLIVNNNGTLELLDNHNKPKITPKPDLVTPPQTPGPQVTRQPTLPLPPSLSTVTSGSLETKTVSQFQSFYSEKVIQSFATSTEFFKLTATKLRIADKATLVAFCIGLDGVTEKECRLNLDEYIGNVDGKLTWGRESFSKTSESITLDGYTLTASCIKLDKTKVTSTLDLTRYLHTHNGVLGVKVPRSDPEFSKFLSEAPWMKFQVVTQPDARVILQSQAIKTAFTSIAHSTVQHVSSSLTRMINVAIEEAVRVVTKSALEHVTTSLEIMLEAATISADVRPATTDAMHLHIRDLVAQTVEAKLRDLAPAPKII